MRIVEKDFKIEYDGTCFVLSFLKSKKELKEDGKESFKTAGYYTNIFNAIRAGRIWREDKKYPFKESPDVLKKVVKDYKIALNKLNAKMTYHYQCIFDFKRKVFDGNR